VREPLLVDAMATDVHGQRDVLRGSERGDQVEGLEDEADAVASEPGELFVVEGGEVGVADEGGAFADGVKPGHAVHECGFSRSGGPHDGGEFSGSEFDGDGVERGDAGVACRSTWKWRQPGQWGR